MGVLVVLGLCSAGCQSNWVAAHPNGLLNAVAYRRAAQPCGEPRSCVIAASTPITAEPALGDASLSSAVTMSAPIIRTSAEEVVGAAPMPVSSYRPIQRISTNDGPSLLDPALDQQPEQIRTAPASRVIQMPMMSNPERLPPPRRMLIQRRMPAQVVSAHQTIEAPQGMEGEIISSPQFGHGGHMTHTATLYDETHGLVHVNTVPREGQKSALPPYVIEPPDVLSVQLLRDPKRVPQPIDGQFLVRPDGSIVVGVYGTVHVAGLTIDDAKRAIADKLSLKLKPYEVEDPDGKKVKIDVADEIVVDVLEYASKYVYLIADGGGYGAQVVRIPVNGSDTVLDTVGKIGGLPPQAAKKKIWLARPSTHQLLPVDWCGISQRAEVATNYQVFPGDRIFVQSDPRIRFDAETAKFLQPLERITGGVLLGASAKNAINARSGSTNNGTTR
jgi:protein involved in polysaccharide export with SLBB domain